MAFQKLWKVVRHAILPVPFKTYLLSGFLAALGRNGYLLTAAWTLAKGSLGANDIAVFLLIASVTELIASPMAGWMVDRFDRRNVYRGAEVTRSATLFLTGLALHGHDDRSAFYVSAIVFSVCDRMSLTAFQAQLPASSSPTPIVTANSLAFFVVQVGNLFAALLCGVLLSACSASIVFMLLAVFSSMAALVLGSNPSVPPVEFRNLHQYRRIFPKVDPALLRLTADYAVLYGTGVLVSVMGAAFILHDLRGSAADFGVMEACWSFGSTFGSLAPMIAFGIARQELVHLVLLQTIAVATIGLLFADAPTHLLLFTVIGASYNAGRVGIEAGIHRQLSQDTQGRTKGLLHSAAMILAILIFLVCANLEQRLSAGSVFASYGGLVMAVSLAIHLFIKPDRRGRNDPIG